MNMSRIEWLVLSLAPVYGNGNSTQLPCALLQVLSTLIMSARGQSGGGGGGDKQLQYVESSHQAVSQPLPKHFKLPCRMTDRGTSSFLYMGKPYSIRCNGKCQYQVVYSSPTQRFQ